MVGPEVEKVEVIALIVGREDCQPLGAVGSGGSLMPHLQLNKILVISKM